MEARKDGSKSLETKQLKSKSTNGYNYGLRIMKWWKRFAFAQLTNGFSYKVFQKIEFLPVFPQKNGKLKQVFTLGNALDCGAVPEYPASVHC
jgi:hypothetical protein